MNRYKVGERVLVAAKDGSTRPATVVGHLEPYSFVSIEYDREGNVRRGKLDQVPVESVERPESEEEIRARISLYGERLARRQLINENLGDDFTVSARGKYVLGLFDLIVGNR